jgi:hypothetical protein
LHRSFLIVFDLSATGHKKAPRFAGRSFQARFRLCLVEIEAVEVHHLVPGSYEVVDKLLLCIGTCIDLRQGAQLRVRAKDEINTGAGPLQLACRAVTPLE